MRVRSIVLLLSLNLLSLAAAAETAPPAAPKGPDIMGTLAGAHSFQTFGRLLTETGLAITLGSDAGYTLFAPDDAAFAKFPAKKLAFLERPEHRDRLKLVMQRYIVVKRFAPEALKNKKIDLPTFDQPVRYDGTTTPPTIEGVPLQGAPIAASSSLIYPLGGVMPPLDKHLYDEE